MTKRYIVSRHPGGDQADLLELASKDSEDVYYEVVATFAYYKMALLVALAFNTAMETPA